MVESVGLGQSSDALLRHHIQEQRRVVKAPSNLSTTHGERCAGQGEAIKGIAQMLPHFSSCMWKLWNSPMLPPMSTQ